MIKLKNILTENSPTVVHISKDELLTLYKTGTLETDGLTIIYGD